MQNKQLATSNQLDSVAEPGQHTDSQVGNHYSLLTIFIPTPLPLLQNDRKDIMTSRFHHFPVS